MELDMCKLTDHITTTEIVAQPQNELQHASLIENKEKEKDKDKDAGVTAGKVIRFDKQSKHEHELLGSLTIQNCPGTRTSARVIQKMKQDQTRPITPPNERDHNKKDEKHTQKTPSSQMRSSHRNKWSNLERNYFFDALNEFGKDFEAIGNCINAKLKRRGTSDFSFKTKDQVRLHYYQTYHKICKYVRYSDEIKKPVQELYTLINYGEMRRKLQFLTEKHFIKLRQLIYQGQVIIRCKGKNIRIKTPSCKALRRLNQLDDSLEDIRLPTKIEVLITPANMESFGRVQVLAQNPRARAIVPLHKKLVNFIKMFQYKWRSHRVKLIEEELKLFPVGNNNEPSLSIDCSQDSEMCFMPKAGVPINRPLVSITEYLSSVNICLGAYEERMGVKVRSESLSHERNPNKRQRTESGSDKRTPELKKNKQMSSPIHDKSLEDMQVLKDDLQLLNTNECETKLESNGIENLMQAKLETICDDELIDDLHDLLMELPSDSANAITEGQTKNEIQTSELTTSASAMASEAQIKKRTTGSSGTTSVTVSVNNTNSSSISSNSSSNNSSNNAAVRQHESMGHPKTNARNTVHFKPLLSDDIIKSIRKGWTLSKAADISIGDLYVVLGQDSKLELEYYWCDGQATTAKSANAMVNNLITTNTANMTASKDQQIDMLHPAMDYMDADCEGNKRQKSIMSANISNKLKHLLIIAQLSDRVQKRQCNCGHSCERNTTKPFLSNVINPISATATAAIGPTMAAAATVTASTSSSPLSTTSDGAGVLFKQPMAPIRKPILSIDPVRPPLLRQKMPRQVLVQRLLLPPGRAQPNYDVLGYRNLQNNLTNDAPKKKEQNNDGKIITDDNIQTTKLIIKNSNKNNNNKDNNNSNNNNNDDNINNNSNNNNNNDNINNNSNNNNSNHSVQYVNDVNLNSSCVVNNTQATPIYADIKSSSSPITTTSCSDATVNNVNAITFDTDAVLTDHTTNNFNYDTTDTAAVTTAAEAAAWDASRPNMTQDVSIDNLKNKINDEKLCGFSMPGLDSIDENITSMPTTLLTYDESTTTNFFNGTMSPMQFFSESSSTSRWLNENLNDFSLTSLLGHLDEINGSRDILDPSSNMSVISESSVDFRHRFQEITALIQNQEKD